MVSKILVALLCFLYTPLLFAQENGATSDNSAALIAKANNGFAVRLYKELLSENKGGLFFSPISIYSAFSMAAAGAEGETLKEFNQTLGTSPEQRKEFSELLTKIGLSNSDDGFISKAVKKTKKLLRQDELSKFGYTLSTANRIWVDESLNVLKSYLDLLKVSFGSLPERVQMQKSPEPTRIRINDWVADQTNDKIKDIIPAGSLNRAFYVLVNAIYFKGTWEAKFSKGATREAPFYIDQEKEKKLPFMFNESKYRYYEDDEAQIIEIPYKSRAVSFLAILPKERTGISKLETGLTFEKLTNWFDYLKKEDVILFLPKFIMKDRPKIVASMKSLGLNSAFEEEKANFKAMTPDRVWIGNALHASFIDVNEEGTEAAAATAVIGYGRASLNSKTIVFRADHPFLFFIRHNETKTILFMGKFTGIEN